jgi:hypothetical protein
MGWSYGLARAAVVEDGLAVGLDQPLAVDRLGPQVLEDLLDRRVTAGFSDSSQWAPSNTGVAMSVDGGVAGRVLDSVPRMGSSPTALPLTCQPQRRA